MKIVPVLLLCLFFGFTAFGQTEENTETAVEAISMWRVGADGKASEETESFLTTDKQLLFRVRLNSTKTATVKMILVVVDVPGVKPETKSVTISYTTNGNQNIVNFKATPEAQWLAGKYRADIFINGKAAGSKEFQIDKSPSSKDRESVPKTGTKPKTVRRGRENR